MSAGGLEFTGGPALVGLRDTQTLLNTATARVRRAFLTDVQVTRATLDLERVEDFLRRGQVQRAIEEAQLASARLEQAVIDAYTAAGFNAAIEIARQRGPSPALRFDLLGPRSVQHVQASQLRLVRALTQESRSVATAVVADGFARGRSPRDIARDLRSTVGLTSAQHRYIENYRADLEMGSRRALRRQLRDRRFDSTVEALATGRRGPLPKAQIDRIVDRYRERWVAHRSLVIAQTEALEAVNGGEDEMWLQAAERGEVPGVAVGVWTPAFRNTRDSHAAMAGQEQPLGQPFRSGLGNRLRYPGDSQAPAADVVNCQCVVARTIKPRA